MSGSDALHEVWNDDQARGGERIRPDRCKSPTLLETLAERDVLAAGYDAELVERDRERETIVGHAGEWDAELSRRDRDRVRLLKRLVACPEGLALKTLVSEVVKGQRPGECERFDGSDADYQFVYRFVRDLEAQEEPLINTHQSSGSKLVTPTYRLLDLISEGITQTTTADDTLVYDQDFASRLLKRSSSIEDGAKNFLEQSLHRYVSRINNYRLLFDVHLVGRAGSRASGASSTHQMTKDYKTRFNDRGRVAKQFARFNQALEYQFERADNAVLVTLTTDPGTYSDPTRPDPRPLHEQISEINPNFNRLLSYFDSDPSTKSDTRREDVSSWSPAHDGSVTGRPRCRPSYIKALEFTEAGYPHLHVLFFDVPTREGDGMPWLCDKAELSKKWQDYGQGKVVDTYPLVYRDDLDELGNFGDDVTEGFVDWYRYGDHDHSREWVAENARSHDLIDFYNLEDSAHSAVRDCVASTLDAVTPENVNLDAVDGVLPQLAKQKTAGAYLGKYLSATFGALLEAGDLEPDDDEKFADKAATWKLAMYWATNRRFWSVSRDIQKGIERTENIRDPAVREGVRWATVDTLERLSKPPVLEHLARRQWDDLDALDDAADWLSSQVVVPAIESTLPESPDFAAVVEYLGAYAYWDLPGSSATAPNLDLVEAEVATTDSPYASSDDSKPPPARDVWEPRAA